MVGQIEECSTLESSLTVNGEASPLGVTSFSAEACEEVTALSPFVYSSYLKPETTNQSLKEYFGRPRLINVGTLPSAGAQANVLEVAINLTNLTTWFPQWANRLAGVYGIKFTTRFRFQVAATPFHQGVVAVSAQYGDASEGFSQNAKFKRTLAPYASTNIPHVRLDVSELTMVELVVPFYYVNEFLPVSGDFAASADIALIGVNTIVPLIGLAGLSAPTYKLYVSLEDIELYGADNAVNSTITLQSGSSVSGFTGKGTMIEELKKNKKISTGLDTAVRISNFIGKNVPSLSAITGPTSWGLGLASGVAKYFGFSHPLHNNDTVKTGRLNHIEEVNVDRPSGCTNVALMSDNTLAFSTNFSTTEVDEMAIKFITSQYSQVCLGQLATTNVHGDVLYATRVTPSFMWFRTPAGRPYCNIKHPRDSSDLISQSGNAFFPSSLMNVSSLFRSWRGTLKFRFTFGKNKFHAGRYMISFNPSVAAAVAPGDQPTTADGPEVAASLVQPYGYSQVIDLKDSNVFEFVVPYMVPIPYLDFYSSSGSLSLVCIDPLIAPASVVSAVPFLVEVAGGDDFELADYSGTLLITHPRGTVYTQSQDLVPSDTPAADFQLESTTTTPCEDTMGECIASLKQVIMLPVYTSAAATDNSLNWGAVIPPWWVSTFQSSAGTLTTPLSATLNYVGAAYTPSFVASMYAFVRGSTDFHAYPLTTNTPHFVEQRAQAAVYNTAVVKGYSGRWAQSCTAKILALKDQPLHARLPSFQRVVRVPAWAFNGQFASLGRVFNNTNNPGILAHGYWLSHFYRYVVTARSTIGDRVLMSCCAGEDAMCSGFLGPEPALIANSLQTTAVLQDANWVNAS